MNQKNNRKKYSLVFGLLLLVISILGVTYALFNYLKVGSDNTLVAGNIYMNHTQGTSISLVNQAPEKREEARARNDNTLTISITGQNESNKDIYYKLLLSHGDDITGKNRIADQYLRFDLVEILANNTEKYIVYNESFSTINNVVLARDRVEAGTSNSITRTYRLRMWIDYDILVSDSKNNAAYTTTQYANLFASVKLVAKGDIQNVSYYSSFTGALDAVIAESYTSNATRNNAKAGVYIDPDDNSTNLVLYDDVTIDYSYNSNISGQKPTVSKPVNINLYGHTITDSLTSGSEIGIIFNNNVTIENGVITGTYQGNNHAMNLVFSGSSTVLNNLEIDYTSSNHNPNFDAYVVATSGNVLIKNSQFTSVNIYSFGIADVRVANIEHDGWVYILSELILEDSTLYHDFSDNSGESVYIGESGFLLVDNSTIFADSPGCYVNSNNGNYGLESIGIYNAGVMIFNSGYVFGTHSGVQTVPDSKTYVYGGTFEGLDHGGFYFAQGADGVAYIQDANISGVNYPANGRLRPNGTADQNITIGGASYTLEEIKSAFYVGGEVGQNGESVYLVNCTISAINNTKFTMRVSTPEQYLYMSGCTIENATSSSRIRIDNLNTMKLYLGSNNHIGGLDKVYYNNGDITFAAARQSGALVDTNVDYKGIVSPGS